MEQGFLTEIKDLIQERKKGQISQDEFLEKICAKFNWQSFNEEKKYVLRCILKVIPDDSLSLLYETL